MRRFYFILRLKIKISYYLMLILFLIPFNFLCRQLVSLLVKIKPEYAFPAILNRTFSPNLYLILCSLLTTFVALLYYEQLIKTEPINIIFINCTFISSIFYILCNWIPEYHRIAYYFLIPMIFLISVIVKLERNIYLRILIVSAISVSWFVFYGYNTAVNASVNNYISIFHPT